MNSAKRPIAVLFLSCFYIAVGTIGFVVNFPKLIALQHESIWHLSIFSDLHSLGLADFRLQFLPYSRIAAKLRRDQLSCDGIKSLSSDLFDQRLH
jgi:hypothetical protein